MAATSMPAATLTALDILRAGGQRAGRGRCRRRRPRRDRAAVDRHRRRQFLSLEAARQEGRRHQRAPAAPRPPPRSTGSNPRASPPSTTPGRIPSPCPAPSARGEKLLAEHGTKGLDEVLQPAIRFAAEGWPVHHRVASDWALAAGKLRKNGSDTFLPGGNAPQGRRHLPPARAG